MTLTLQVGTNTYVTQAGAQAYIDGCSHSAPWDAANNTSKIKALATATRMLERCTWAGQQTVNPQTLQWPRANVVDKYGNAVNSATVPNDIINAEIELALALLADPEIQNQANTMQTNKLVEAGPVKVEFFRLPRNLATKFPKIVNDLISQYFGSAANGTQFGTAYGIDRLPSFEDDDGDDDSFKLNKGF